MASNTYHIMMFPWLAFGHMLPFFEFAKRLAEKGTRVSFISTPRNIERLPPLADRLSENLNLVKVPLPLISGLPENCEATIDLQPDEVQYLKVACDELRDPVEQLLNLDLPDLILFDFVISWIPQVAKKLGVRCAFFSAYAASTLAFLGPPAELKSIHTRKRPEDLAVVPQWLPLTSLVSQRMYQAARMFKNLYFPDVSGMSSGQRWDSTLEGCDFVAVRSCEEFEGQYLELLREFYQKPVIPVGLLPPNVKEHLSLHSAYSSWLQASKWLDQQEVKSVVFVGFGTEYKMPLSQIHELAFGLELSRLPFFWILRKPEEMDSSKLLPDGFLDRTSNRGMVSLGWALQVKILAHPAIGGCLYHSGWSSLIESLGFGHPQILMPMVDDQGLNAKLLVEKGVALEVCRNEDGSFARDEVAKSIRLVMVEEKGERLRSQAEQVRGIFADQDLHNNYVSKFIEFINLNQNGSSHRR